MPTRGIRGAITVASDDLDLILDATRELLEEILAENNTMLPEDIASAFFTWLTRADGGSITARGASSTDCSPKTDDSGREVGNTSPESARADSVAMNCSRVVTLLERAG